MTVMRTFPLVFILSSHRMKRAGTMNPGSDGAHGLGHAETKRLDNLSPDEIARMGRVLHGRYAPPNDSRSSRYRWRHWPLRRSEESSASFP